MDMAQPVAKDLFLLTGQGQAKQGAHTLIQEHGSVHQIPIPYPDACRAGGKLQPFDQVADGALRLFDFARALRHPLLELFVAFEYLVVQPDAFNGAGCVAGNRGGQAQVVIGEWLQIPAIQRNVTDGFTLPNQRRPQPRNDLGGSDRRPLGKVWISGEHITHVHGLPQAHDVQARCVFREWEAQPNLDEVVWEAGERHHAQRIPIHEQHRSAVIANYGAKLLQQHRIDLLGAFRLVDAQGRLMQHLKPAAVASQLGLINTRSACVRHAVARFTAFYADKARKSSIVPLCLIVPREGAEIRRIFDV